MISSALLRTALSIEPYEGHSATGPVFGEAFDAMGMVTSKKGRVALPDGSLAQTVAQVLLRPDVEVPVGSRVSGSGRTMIAHAVETQGDLVRPFCLSLSLGWGAP